jgi:hypothetical protein
MREERGRERGERRERGGRVGTQRVEGGGNGEGERVTFPILLPLLFIEFIISFNSTAASTMSIFSTCE